MHRQLAADDLPRPGHTDALPRVPYTRGDFFLHASHGRGPAFGSHVGRKSAVRH